jgi:PAS domain S-box-containing protein
VVGPAEAVSIKADADPEAPAWLAGGGEMGARVRAKDWSATPLGSPETWSPSVKTAVSICLNARVPIALWLGPELRLVYNDTYIPFLGETKHPAILGAPGREAWAEIWATIAPMHDEVAAGRATSVEDVQLFFARRLPREEVYVSWGYSPILAADGVTIEGTFDACTETTAKVVGERRLATLRDLGARSPERRTAEVACRDAAEVLHSNPLDIPFAGIYLLDEKGTRACRVAGTRLPDGSTAFPENHPVIDGDATSGPWPLVTVVETQQCCQVSDLPGNVGVFPAGAWPDAVETAFVLPLAAPTQPRPAGFLIAGVSPRRILDAGYRSFLDLVAGHIATSIAEARAFEAERKRAEALAEIDRAKTTFFSNVSHEFRTPLTLMLNPLEEVLAKPEDEVLPENHQLLEIAYRNSLRLLRLVNTLLDFSRVEAGRIQASYEPVDLPRLTAEIASNFRSACERAGLMLVVDCPPIREPVYVDREMWEKILLNLLSNAFKFTLQGRIEVALRGGAANVSLTVSDTGVGIPEAELPRIFERFHRIEGQHGRTYEGTGIGLALVQELVRQHGGQIAVHSRIGQGTTFTVSIPLGSGHLPTDRISAPRMLASSAIGAQAFVEEALRWLPADSREIPLSEPVIRDIVPTVSEQSANDRAYVLFADDNADMRDYVSRLLSSRWDVEAVADGQAALEAARQRKPDLVLADIMMPRLNGLGLLSALRGQIELRDVPVILLSARAGEEARVEGLDAGADDYLVKPFSARELIARVSSHLALSRLRADELATMSRLHELSSRLISVSDLTSALYEILDATVELQGADFGNIQLYDNKTQTLGIAAQRGFQREFLDHFASVDADEGSAWGEALKRQSRVILEDVNLDAEFQPHRHIAAAAGFRAVQSTPLVDRGSGEPVGMLSTHFRSPGRPSDRELRLTDLYAHLGGDVIARRISEQRLRESEARLQAAVDLVGLGCYSWDPQTNALDWDARLKAMWGLPAEAHVDYEVFITGVHPEDRARVEAAIAKCADPRGDGICDIEYRVRGIGDGVERWVTTRGQTYFENRTATGFLGVALDITDRKKHAAALQHLNETLELRVAQRAAEAEEANQKLRSEIVERARAETRLQRLRSELYHAARLSAMGQMAGALAHELNQPLGAAVNFGNAARRLLAGGDRSKIDPARRNLEDAAAQLLRAGQIIRRLRDFVGQGETEKRVEDPANIIEEASALALIGSDALSVETRYHFDAGASLVFVDRVQIQQVLVNLMRNGLEAMSESQRRELVVTTTLRDQATIEISVADSGPGLAPEVRERLFQPFISTKRGGMGLGLSICRRIVEAHGGQLWSEPNPTGGTIFRFSLAAAPRDERDDAD